MAAYRCRHTDTKRRFHTSDLEAGADPTIVAGWIAEVESDRRSVLAVLNRPAPALSNE